MKRKGFTNASQYGFGIKNGYGFGTDVENTNLCVTQGNDGVIEWYGAKRGIYPAWEYGLMEPDEIEPGLPYYSFRWKADGSFILELGTLGENPVPDVDVLVSVYKTFSVTLNWDPNVAVLGYVGTNLDMATQLIADAGENCFGVSTSFNNVTHNGELVTHNGVQVIFKQ